VLRIADLTHAPPGLNQDEAIGAWISWCLLKTGHDMTGQAWPIFYTHGIGDYPSTLFLYMTIPFQWLGGLNVWTTRLPGAVSGVLGVPLVAHVGARLFDRRTGLMAALLLALNPWHLFLSRFAVGASHCAMFALLAMALLLAARLPLAGQRPLEEMTGAPGPRAPRAGLALLAGLSAGLACYGYPPLRMYFPALFALVAIVQWRALRETLATRAGRLAIGALALGFAVPFIPLAIVHLRDPAISHRWEMTRLWDPGASVLEIAGLVFGRYLDHFGLGFLFLRGDRFLDVNPLMAGAFPWIVLPLFLVGALVVLLRWRESASARTLAALVLAYPAGDLVSRYASVHAQRSAAGAGALALLAALGAISLAGAIGGLAGARQRGQRAFERGSRIGTGVVAAVVIALHIPALVRFYRDFDRSPEIQRAYHVSLVSAMRWLEPRLTNFDAVFCTVQGMNEPFSIALIGLDYDPHRWFAEVREVKANGEWEVTTRFGKLWFMYDDSWQGELTRLANEGRHARVLFITPPGESHDAIPLETIRAPDGAPDLIISERQL